MNRPRLGIFIFLIYIITAGAYHAMGTECFVVSGASPEKDPKSVFAKRKIFITDSLRDGMYCTVVGSWEELNRLLNDSKITKGSEILIVQEAHGGPGGSAYCNDGDSSGDE